MAAAINDRDVLLQAASPRLIAVDLPPNVNLPASGTLNNIPVQTVIDNAASGYSKAQLNADLASGVESVLAGVGGDFELNIDKDNNIIFISHKDAVYNGTASPGSNKLGLAISANGIGMGYNRSSDGAWIDGVSINSTGNAAFAGTVAASSVISTSASIEGTALSIQDFVDKSNEPPPTGDNTVSILENSGTTITVNSSTLFRTSTGNGGVFLGGGGFFGKNTSGTTTFSIDGATGSPMFIGSITGGSDINITGSARFRGATSSSDGSAAGVFNDTGTQTHGVISYSLTGNGSAVAGFAQTSGGGNGVLGIALGSTDRGVRAQRIGSGTALSVSGPMTVSSTSLVSNLYAARAATADQVNASDITGTIDADTFQASSKSSFVRAFWCNSGTTSYPASSIPGLRVTGSLFTVDQIQTRASGEGVFIEDVSDSVRKSNVEPIVLGLDFINNLIPRTYEMTEKMGRKIHGFLANEIATIPGGSDMTAWNQDGVMSFSHKSLIAPLVRSTQQIDARLVECENAIISLNTRIAALKVLS